ncbi:MAG: hypothetical protein V5783_08835 [Pontiella sp.]
MKCHEAEKWILLQGSDEITPQYERPLAAHLHDCEPCRKFMFSMIEVEHAFQATEEPSATTVQNVLREARLNAPQKNRATIWLFKPAFTAAAALLIGVGLFFSVYSPDKVGMELVVNETQLLTSEEQVALVMYNSLSDDDLAFNFLMTYEDNYASL